MGDLVEHESFEEFGITLEDRACRLCVALYRAMRQVGVVTTVHFDTGQPLIVRAMQAAIDDKLDQMRTDDESRD